MKKITPLKVGDKGIMTKSGIRYLSGEAKDSIVYNIVDRPSYDTENIAKRILQNLKYDVFRFEDLLYDEEIKDEEVINSILEELEEFI
ncbi:hypothetical protein K5V21_13875 [Clostridium sardiniense]|uniref:Uncharacterized protein n=1 Tax=Clostridium sardiniense TaxID=29369 RepID=A0ABS7L110_CLOSR|nr:hypothetical protein [Clostridium sardiniense]MBY0756532.1 hypothetical protein [Clostridium sardiniense]MDQ0460280.1 hypothetical protein [Clostridium sardiniense]